MSYVGGRGGKGLGQCCRTEPLPYDCGVWHYLWVDNVRITQLVSYTQKIAWRGQNPPHIGEQKYQKWSVLCKSKADSLDKCIHMHIHTHSREELGFSLHRKEKSGFSLFSLQRPEAEEARKDFPPQVSGKAPAPWFQLSSLQNSFQTFFFYAYFSLLILSIFLFFKL